MITQQSSSEECAWTVWKEMSMYGSREGNAVGSFDGNAVGYALGSFVGKREG